MRRLLAVAAVAALATPRAGAQVDLGFGFAGGANFADLQDAGALDLDRSVGYHVGLYADVGVPFVAGRVGVYYVDAGSFEGADADDNTASYVAVPVDVQFKTPTPLVQAYVLVGPEARFAVDGLDTFDQQDHTLAGNVGLGLRGGVPLVGPSGFLELRYGLDLTGLRDTDAEDDVKVNLIQLRAGLGF